MVNIPELNQRQFDTIRSLIAQGNVLFAVMENTESDDTDKIAKIEQNQQDIQSLSDMGFVRDCSGNQNFVKLIDNAKQAGQRPFKVYSLTEMALMCFSTVNGQGAVN